MVRTLANKIYLGAYPGKGKNKIKKSSNKVTKKYVAPQNQVKKWATPKWQVKITQFMTTCSSGNTTKSPTPDNEPEKNSDDGNKG